MISARATLTRLGFSIDSPLRAVQEVRNLIEASKTPQHTAYTLVYNVTGLTHEDVFSHSDVATAIHLAQHIVLTFVVNESYDEDMAWNEAIKKDVQVRKDLPWAFEKADSAVSTSSATSAVSGITTQVALKSDGSIKKGGKQVLTVELYKTHVLNTPTPVTSKTFTDMLVSQLGLSKSCASTYSYNARKSCGGVFAVN